TWRARDKYRHDGRCDCGDGREHLSPPRGTSRTLDAVGDSGGSAGNRTTDVLRNSDRHRSLPASLHAAGYRRKTVQAPGLCGHVFDDWFDVDGVVHCTDALRAMAAS